MTCRIGKRPASAARRLAPGVYSLAGELHIDVPELLEAQGYADTPENRDTVADAARAIAKKLGIPTTVE